jgi:hypothetical protein
LWRWTSFILTNNAGELKGGISFIDVQPEDIDISSYESLAWLPAGSVTPQNVAVIGDPAPGTQSGVEFPHFDSSDANDTGSILFRPTLQGPGVTPTNSWGYWIGKPGDVRKVLRAGEEVPGHPGVFWGGGTFLPSISDNGRAVIDINLTGAGVDASNRSAIVTGAPGEAKMIARAGDQAPGVESGVVYTSLGQGGISETGRVAFTSLLSGPGVTTANQSALWQYSPEDDAVHLLLRSGEVLEVAPGDFRTIQALSLGSLPWHMPDQVSFNASFTDGTRGIFIATVPEPGALLLLGLAVPLCRLRSRRRIGPLVGL